MLTGNGMLAAIALAISYILFHSPLSQDDVGTWFFVQSIISFCEMGRAGFLSTATVKFYAGASPERAKTVLGSVWFIAIVITIIILSINACCYAAAPFVNNREYSLCVEWVGITFLATLPSDVISWKLQAEERYGTMLRFRILNSICSILSFAVLILFHEMTLEKALFFNFLINVATSSIGMLFRLGGLRNITCRTKACIMEIFHYGKYTFGTTSVSNLLGSADVWIINFMLGPAAVAIYNLGMRFIQFVELLLRSFAVTGMSAMAIAYNNNNMKDVAAIFRKYSGMLTMLLIPLAAGTFFLGDFPLELLGGENYQETEAANFFKMMMFFYIMIPIERLTGVTLDIIHQTRINFIKVIIMLTLKVAMDFLGIYFFHNIYGIVAAFAVVHLTAMWYGNYQLQKHLEYTMPEILSTGYTELRYFIRQKLVPASWKTTN